MTTIYKEEKRCALCGKSSKYPKTCSTNTFGSPDLDTRPPEMKRSTIMMWIQRCPSCGYCAPNISEWLEKSSEIVRSASYQYQLNNPEFPELANAFLCFSLIQESAGEYATAGWACIHAAWACDDAGFNANAQKCRKRAVMLLQKAKEKGQSFAEQAGAEEAIMVDLMRRSSQFELALKLCDDVLKKTKSIIADILQFQRILISKKDVTCHTIAEAMGQNE